MQTSWSDLLHVFVTLTTEGYITVCMLRLSQLYILKCTTQWNWEYWVIGRPLQGIKTRRSTNSKLSTSIQYSKTVGKWRFDGLFSKNCKSNLLSSNEASFTSEIKSQCACSKQRPSLSRFNRGNSSSFDTKWKVQIWTRLGG